VLQVAGLNLMTRGQRGFLASKFGLTLQIRRKAQLHVLFFYKFSHRNVLLRPCVILARAGLLMLPTALTHRMRSVANLLLGADRGCLSVDAGQVALHFALGPALVNVSRLAQVELCNIDCGLLVRSAQPIITHLKQARTIANLSSFFKRHLATRLKAVLRALQLSLQRNVGKLVALTQHAAVAGAARNLHLLSAFSWT
jgi:hypothetical protein